MIKKAKHADLTVTSCSRTRREAPQDALPRLGGSTTTKLSIRKKKQFCKINLHDQVITHTDKGFSTKHMTRKKFLSVGRWLWARGTPQKHVHVDSVGKRASVRAHLFFNIIQILVALVGGKPLHDHAYIDFVEMDTI